MVAQDIDVGKLCALAEKGWELERDVVVDAEAVLIKYLTCSSVSLVMVPFQTKGQEVISTLRLGGTQLHNRSVFPRRKGKLLHVAWPCTTMDVRNCAAWALMLKALIWNESWIRK